MCSAIPLLVGGSGCGTTVSEEDGRSLDYLDSQSEQENLIVTEKITPILTKMNDKNIDMAKANNIVNIISTNVNIKIVAQFSNKNKNFFSSIFNDNVFDPQFCKK